MKNRHLKKRVLVSFGVLSFLFISTNFAAAAYISGISPAAWWQVEEDAAAGGFVEYVDQIGGSGGANGGDCQGTCPAVSVDGIVNNAQDFSGNTGIQIPASGNPAPNATFDWLKSENFSIELWVKSGPVSSTEVVMSRDDDATSANWWIGITGQGKAAFYLRDNAIVSNSLQVTGATDVDDSNWHHIVAVRETDINGDGTNRLYVDGRLENSESMSYTGDFISQDAPLVMGHLLTDLVTPEYRYGGLVDEAAIYGFALPADIIAQHYMEASDLGYCRPGGVLPPDDDNGGGGGGGGGGSCFINTINIR